jgi:hypothetical protein
MAAVRRLYLRAGGGRYVTLAGCGMNKPRMRSTTPNFTAGHMDAVIRVFDEAGNVIETHEHAGNFKEW